MAYQISLQKNNSHSDNFYLFWCGNNFFWYVHLSKKAINSLALQQAKALNKDLVARSIIMLLLVSIDKY